jgi:hypothetical protein
MGYIQIEKKRIHQNSVQLLRQSLSNQANRNFPTGRDLIQTSAYGDYNVISEKITTGIPAIIRTGDTYFHQKELHLNTMIETFGLPTIFVTFTFSERWPQLIRILQGTDNHDTLSTNRPLHATLHWHERLKHINNGIGKKTPIFRNSESLNIMLIVSSFRNVVRCNHTTPRSLQRQFPNSYYPC